MFYILYYTFTTIFRNSFSYLTAVRCAQAYQQRKEEKEMEKSMNSFLEEIKDEQADEFHEKACEIMVQKGIFKGKDLNLGKINMSLIKMKTFRSQIKELLRLGIYLDKEKKDTFLENILHKKLRSIFDDINKTGTLPSRIREKIAEMPLPKKCTNIKNHKKDEECKTCEEYEICLKIREIKRYSDLTSFYKKLKSKFKDDSVVYDFLENLSTIESMLLDLDKIYSEMFEISCCYPFVSTCWLFYFANCPVLIFFIDDKIMSCPKCKELFKEYSDNVESLHEKIKTSLECEEGQCFLNNDYKMVIYYLTKILDMALNHKVHGTKIGELKELVSEYNEKRKKVEKLLKELS